jgi:hypothetical protein
MKTKKNTHTPTVVPVLTDIAQANISHVVVVAPDGHKEGFDNRTYQCLVKGCGNRGSVNEGAYKRQGSYTICNACGGDFNRWVREAAV